MVDCSIRLPSSIMSFTGKKIQPKSVGVQRTTESGPFYLHRFCDIRCGSWQPPPATGPCAGYDTSSHAQRSLDTLHRTFAQMPPPIPLSLPLEPCVSAHTRPLRVPEERRKQRSRRVREPLRAVEATLSCSDRFRKLLVRREGKEEDCLAPLQFACAIIIRRRSLPVHR